MNNLTAFRSMKRKLNADRMMISRYSLSANALDTVKYFN